MSTKGDLVTSNATSSFPQHYYNDAGTLKTSATSSKKILNTSPTPLTSKSSSFTQKTPGNSDGHQPRAQSPTTSNMNFASRFLTKSPLRALTIDTANESSSYNVLDTNRLTALSATHNPAPQHVHTGNTLISSLNGNLSAKYSRAVESYRRPSQISPSKGATISNSLSIPKPMIASNFPYSTANQSSGKILSTLGSDFARSLLSSITPTGLHFKKLTNKSYSQDRHKVALYTSFDSKRPQTNQFRKTSTTSALESSRSFNTTDNSEISHNNDQSGEINLQTIFKSLKGSFGNPSPLQSGKKLLTPIPNHEPTKCSVKRNGIVKAYAANTNQGIVRNYNEDRVSIILNIMKPASRVNEEWPKCSFFGVYDGHGGVTCADFLRDNLHQYVIKEASFPWNPKEALMKGFEAAEKAFLELADGGRNKEVDRSGSCALVVLIVGEMCYVANVGDSRAVMSGDSGAKIYPLSKDHKPNEENEQKRIIEAGGKIYQSQAPVSRPSPDGSNTTELQLLLGPHRVLPGRLSVSRTFGDIEAKLQKFGGNPNVVIAIPEIKAFKVNPEYDFIVLATDGIYDKLSSRDVVRSVWESTHELAPNIHHQCGLAVENILRESINRRTLDNITVVMICFKNFKHKLFPQENSTKSETQDLTQKDSDTSSSMHKSFMSSPTNNIEGNLDFSAKKEKQNLQEKLNIDEKANIPEKSANNQKSNNNIDLMNANVGNIGLKRSATSFRENNSSIGLDLSHKKENKEKEAVPISDVNLMSKKLLAKKGSEIQKQQVISARALTQGDAHK